MNLQYYTITTQTTTKNFESKEKALKYYHTLKDDTKKLYEITVTPTQTTEKELHPIKKDLVEITWYEITNTIDEYHSTCTGKYDTYEEALEDLKNKEDWYRSKGIGNISECRIDNLTYTIERKVILRK